EMQVVLCYLVQQSFFVHNLCDEMYQISHLFVYKLSVSMTIIATNRHNQFLHFMLCRTVFFKPGFRRFHGKLSAIRYAGFCACGLQMR
ncbi:MAG TPA: hypothetical protein PKN17_04630, partial [Bacillota bacterium]|nr:hypothetical protein [Bacillota bacterium]